MMDTSKIALYNAVDATPALSPAEAIAEMFELTDESGVLYTAIPPTYEMEDDEDHIYRCVMDWNEEDRDSITAEFEKLYSDIEQIATMYREAKKACPDGDYPEPELTEEQEAVKNTYLTEFGDYGIDHDEILEIQDKLNSIAYAETVAEDLAKGLTFTEEEMDLYNDCKKVTVSEEEMALYGRYKEMVYAESRSRVGDNIAAYDVVIRALRLGTVIRIDAPKRIIENEARCLAQAMVIHAYGKSWDEVDDNGTIKMQAYYTSPEDICQEISGVVKHGLVVDSHYYR